jgi:hypothetical protein
MAPLPSGRAARASPAPSPAIIFFVRVRRTAGEREKVRTLISQLNPSATKSGCTEEGGCHGPPTVTARSSTRSGYAGAASIYAADFTTGFHFSIL